MLERIQKENDIKELNSEELECLAGDIWLPILAL